MNYLKDILFVIIIFPISIGLIEYLKIYIEFNENEETALVVVLSLIIIFIYAKFRDYVVNKISIKSCQSFFSKVKSFLLISWKYVLALTITVIIFQLFFRYETISFRGVPAKIDRITGNVWVWQGGNWKCLKCDK